MSREFDFVIFGFTGYTGKYVLRNIILSNKIENTSWKVAVAGRDKQKIISDLTQLSHELDDPVDNIGIIVADVSDEDSLDEMCVRTRLVLNCVGPYILYGEPVVKSCIKVIMHLQI